MKKWEQFYELLPFLCKVFSTQISIMKRKKGMANIKRRISSSSVNEKKENVLNIKNISVLLTVFAAVYASSNLVFNYIYQNKCEKFYGIPGKYFSSNIDNRLIYLITVVIK